MLYLKLVKNSEGTMRFIHTGDIHLGATPESKRPWAANRGDEIWNTLERLIKKINISPAIISKSTGSIFIFLIKVSKKFGRNYAIYTYW